MEFFDEAKKTNQKQMHLEKNAVFFKSCATVNVAPTPLLSQITDGRLNLICYQISEELAFAMGEQLRNESMNLKKKKAIDETKLHSLMLYDNGLKDTGFS